VKVATPSAFVVPVKFSPPSCVAVSVTVAPTIGSSPSPSLFSLSSM
jgi:hypothetical protein